MTCLATVTRLSALLLALASAELSAQGGTRRVIVVLRSTSAEAALRAPGGPPVTATEMAQIAARLDRELPSLRELGRAPFVGMFFAEVSTAESARLAADSNVALVEDDRLWGPADALTTLNAASRSAPLNRSLETRADAVPWGISRVTAPEVWAGGNSGAGVKVGVLDSGIDTAHPDLQVVGGFNAISQTTTDYNDTLSVCNGHGTHIAGTIAAKANGVGVVGVAPSAQLYAIKVFENIGGACLARTSSQIVGLNWAVTQGIRLVNVSIGALGESFTYELAMQAAANQGTYVIAAAGNSGGVMLYPGFSAQAIGVGALDGANNRASFSSTGPELDFSAPGVGITSTMPGGGYADKSGTSMATPHVVGVSALILSAYPSLTFAQLYQKLRDGALDLESAGFDNNTGYGLVRAANSISGTPPPPPPLVLAVSPTSRNVAVVQGASAPVDQATVTLSGTNSSTTAWSATKRKAWTTLTTGSGTGSGTLAWSRNATGLAVGTYVDTLTVTAIGATGSPSVMYDTLRITVAPVPPTPITVAVTPGSRRVAIAQGSSAPNDSASVTLSGAGSASTAWTATRSANWATLTTSSGTGNGMLRWSRSAGALAVGTYVDTIWVTAGSATALLLDTVSVTSAPKSIAFRPKGKRSRVLTAAGAATDIASTVDSALVEGEVASGESDLWQGSTPATRLRLVTQSGQLNRHVVWDRLAVQYAPGTYVDSVIVTLQSDPAVKAVFTDTLEVVAVQLPEPITAVEELFRAGQLSDDQRTLFDREGNRNGVYDLGDFLAWVDRAHLRLSPEAASRLQGLMVRESGPAAARLRSMRKD